MKINVILFQNYTFTLWRNVSLLALVFINKKFLRELERLMPSLVTVLFTVKYLAPLPFDSFLSVRPTLTVHDAPSWLQSNSHFLCAREIIPRHFSTNTIIKITEKHFLEQKKTFFIPIKFFLSHKILTCSFQVKFCEKTTNLIILLINFNDIKYLNWSNFYLF